MGSVYTHQARGDGHGRHDVFQDELTPAMVRRQMLQLWKDVNARRKTARLSLLPIEVLPLRRKVMKPFEPRPGYEVAE